MTCGRCKDGWNCEAHPNKPWPHDDCAGPGMQCDIQTVREAIRHGRDRQYPFEGEAALGRLLSGVAGVPTYVASPPGFEDAWIIPVVGKTRDLSA